MAAVGGLSRIHQISMRAHDVDRAVRFYRDTLGCPSCLRPRRASRFSSAAARLMLSTPEQVFPITRARSLYFAVEDIRQMHEALSSRGVAFRTAPHKIATLADREVWLADFEDSEGNTLALMSEPRLS